MQHPTFVAIDFETAHYDRDSACSVALVRVEHGRIVRREQRLIKPPRRAQWMFQHIHGISRDDVADAPGFGAVWPGLEPLLAGAAGLVAHNAPFDRGVLLASCRGAGLPEPQVGFLDSVRGARKAWNLASASLEAVCAHLDIPLARHHDALCDAEATAHVWLEVLAELGEDAWTMTSPANRPARASSPSPRASARARLGEHAARLARQARAGRGVRHDAGTLLALLRAVGGRGGNLALADALGWDAERYTAAKQALLQAGHVVAGVGRGGTLRLAP